MQPSDAPLLYSLLNDFADQLVAVVGAGVGIAVLLGILRFFLGWSLKLFILPLVTALCALTLYAQSSEILQPVLGLAWDCGAVTTGPVTVPLVLALGIGVCRIVGDGDVEGNGCVFVTGGSACGELRRVGDGLDGYRQIEFGLGRVAILVRGSRCHGKHDLA